MVPAKFPESNKTLGAPPGMADCDPLDVWTDGNVCISRWRMSWGERFAALFHGRVWLWVYYGQTQPPVALLAKRQVFIEPPSRWRTWWRERWDAGARAGRALRRFIRLPFRRTIPPAMQKN